MRARQVLLPLAVSLAIALVTVAAHPANAAAGRVYYLPAAAGTRLVVTQGQNTAGDHDAAHYSQYALDFGIAGNGEFAVTAARAGTVIGLRDNSQAHCYVTDAGAYDWSCWKDANYVLVDHHDNTSALYMHLATGSAAVKVGDDVLAGQMLAMDDNIGFSSANHLHFMVETTPTVPSTAPPGPTDKTAVAWWWTISQPVSFSDPDVLKQASDGIPKYGMTVTSGSPTPTPTPTPTVWKPFGPLRVSVSADCMMTITYTGEASPTKEVLIANAADANASGGSIKTFGQSALSKDPHTIITPWVNDHGQGLWVMWFPVHPNDPTVVHVTSQRCVSAK